MTEMWSEDIDARREVTESGCNRRGKSVCCDMQGVLTRKVREFASARLMNAQNLIREYCGIVVVFGERCEV